MQTGETAEKVRRPGPKWPSYRLSGSVSEPGCSESEERQPGPEVRSPRALVHSGCVCFSHSEKLCGLSLPLPSLLLLTLIYSYRSAPKTLLHLYSGVSPALRRKPLGSTILCPVVPRPREVPTEPPPLRTALSQLLQGTLSPVVGR